VHGSATVTVSQAQRGGQWNELGVFAFAGGQDYSVTLTDDANGTVVADAVYIVKAEALTDAVTWVPALPASGTYQVYAKWTADETRATDARYVIVHEGGTAEVSVNQRAAGGVWQYLGSYTFDPLNTPTVSLAANDNGSVAADAMRFVGGPGGATDIAYLHADHLGTPQTMTDANAQVLWWRDQTPFGQTVAEGGFSVSPLRFPGQYADAESGLAYNYFRDYDPALGRYIQSDPIGLRGGLNTYGYVGGNPLRFVDPRGTAPYVLPTPELCKRIGKYIPWVCSGANGNENGGNPPANDNDPQNGDGNDDSCEVDCEEWLSLLTSQYWRILIMKGFGADTSLLEREYEQSAALFCQVCPEFCDRLRRF
jgi:RHS repeat-associated protein